MSDAATIWEAPAGTIPVVNANGNVFEEVQVATAAQTVFTLTTFQYTPGTKSIFVYRKSGGIGGQMLRRNIDYTETSATQVTMTAGATVGDLYFFLAIAISQIAGPPVINGLPGGGTTGQVLAKTSGSDYAVNWTSLAALGTLLDAARVNVASASTVDLTPQSTVTRNIQITGTTQIDGFQITNGQLYAIKFQSALVLKNNAAIVTQAGVDIQVSAGDTCFIRATADNVVEVLGYAKASSGLVDPVNDFRLTLAAGTPVTTVDVAAASTIYCSPYKGNKIALYSGGAWKLYQSAEFSVALAGLTVGRPYDVFCYDNAGAPALELLAWASTTARATALVRQDGVLVKTGDPTRRYLGSFHALTATTTADTLRQRLLWNYYNRVIRRMSRTDGTATWAYNSAVIRQARADPLNQLEVMCGVIEDDIEISGSQLVFNTTAGQSMTMSIGLNSTVATMAGASFIAGIAPANNLYNTAHCKYSGYSSLGFNIYTWLEAGAAATTSFHGTNNASFVGCVRA